jgi:hypothetical protein
LLGEDLGPLSVKELQNLEKQLEGALAQARQRKVYSIYRFTYAYNIILTLRFRAAGWLGFSKTLLFIRIN